MKLYKDDPCVCQVGPARAAYPHVFKARQNDLKTGNPYEYSITLLIPKEKHDYLPDPTAECNGIKACMKAATEKKFGGKLPPKLAIPLKDGDTELNGEGDPRFPGYWFIKASTNAHWPDGSDKNMMVIDGSRNPIGSGFNGGDWCRCKVKFDGFDKGKNQGVACYLEAVQWLYKDEPKWAVGGATDPDEFEPVGAVVGAPAPDEYDPFAEE